MKHAVLLLLLSSTAYANDAHDNEVNFIYNAYSSCIENYPPISTNNSTKLTNCKMDVVKLGQLLKISKSAMMEGINNGMDDYDNMQCDDNTTDDNDDNSNDTDNN